MNGVPKEDRTVTRSKKILLGIGGALLALAILAIGGTWVYISVIKDEPPAKLSFESEDASSTTVAAASAGSSATTAAANGAATTAGDSSGSADSSGSIDGDWTASDQSQLGYRVKEVLFGQSTEGVGRTNAITGSLTIDGTTVQKGDFTVDMTTVQSDSGNRDNQFQGRIMDTSKFPTSNFTLTQPIDLGSVPAEGQTVSAKATGDLTLRGTTKPVTFDVQARLKDGRIEVNGSIPIVFADYNIPNPSFGPASTADNGTLEFLLVFTKG
jgi:polyisoprenoid-binding protein YceI